MVVIVLAPAVFMVAWSTREKLAARRTGLLDALAMEGLASDDDSAAFGLSRRAASNSRHSGGRVGGGCRAIPHGAMFWPECYPLPPG